MVGVFLSFGIIFVAELGDKSQLMAMAFAARYKALPVLLGISIATAVTHALSVGLGSVVGDQMPTASISIVAGVAFLGFAGWTLRGDTLSDDEAQAAQKNSRNAVVAASMAFSWQSWAIRQCWRRSHWLPTMMPLEHGRVQPWE